MQQDEKTTEFVLVAVRVPLERAEAFDDLCRREYRTRSDMLRLLIDKAIEQAQDGQQ